MSRARSKSRSGARTDSVVHANETAMAHNLPARRGPTVSGTAHSADEGRATITATRQPKRAALIIIYGARIGGPTTTPRPANTWPQVGMNGRPFLACAMLVGGAS